MPDIDPVKVLAQREFTNELGNRIKITIEGPTSISENILTPMEVEELEEALDASAKAMANNRIVQRLAAVVVAARKLPRSTPKAGGSSTLHDFKIEACHVWALDRALCELDRSLSFLKGPNDG